VRWTGHVARMGERLFVYWILVGRLREGDHLEDPGLYWWILLKLIFKKWDGGMDWIDVAQDRDRWRAFVKVAMNLWVP